MPNRAHRLLLTMALALAIPPTAAAQTTLVGAPTGDLTLQQSWVDEALVPTPDVTVDVLPENCGENFACVSIRRRPMMMRYPAMGYDAAESYDPATIELLHVAFMHEIGHVFDYTPGPKRYRAAFARIMRYPLHRSWESIRLSDGSTILPNEDFAAAYSLCSLWPHYAQAQHAIAAAGDDGFRPFSPTPMQYERACFLISRA